MERLREIFANVCIKTKCRLIEFSGEPDHIHLLIDFHPDNNLSVLVGSLKSASSRIIQKEFSEHLATIQHIAGKESTLKLVYRTYALTKW